MKEMGNLSIMLALRLYANGCKYMEARFSYSGLRWMKGCCSYHLPSMTNILLAKCWPSPSVCRRLFFWQALDLFQRLMPFVRVRACTCVCVRACTGLSSGLYNATYDVIFILGNNSRR